MSALQKPVTQADRSKKFIILALPRSRTAWLQKFLSYGGHEVGHDIAIGCSSMAEFIHKFDQLSGTIETGAVIAWRTIRALLPEVQIIVIKRPVEAIIQSFKSHGISSELLEKELIERAVMLNHVSAQAGVITLSFDELSDKVKCNLLFEGCTNMEYDPDWWNELKDENIQIDIWERIQSLMENRAKTEALKRDAIKCLPEVIIEVEAFPSMWPEVNDLFSTHFEEVDGDVEPNRPYKLNVQAMMALHYSGIMKIISARVKGKLVGYITWNVTPDVESDGLLIAQQGAWYVSPDHEGFGIRLFKTSIKELKKLGVQNIFPHHRLQGRGQRLGLLFQRMGAKEIQRTYSMWIGDN